MKRITVVLLSICLASSFTGCAMRYPKPEEPPVYFWLKVDDFLLGHCVEFLNVFYGEGEEIRKEKAQKEFSRENFQEKDIGDECIILSARWDDSSMRIFCKEDKIYRVEVEGNPQARNYAPNETTYYTTDMRAHLQGLAGSLRNPYIEEGIDIRRILLNWMDKKLPEDKIWEEEASGIRLRVERVNEKREIITVTPLAE